MLELGCVVLGEYTIAPSSPFHTFPSLSVYLSLSAVERREGGGGADGVAWLSRWGVVFEVGKVFVVLGFRV
jgi:hypothetical protein